MSPEHHLEAAEAAVLAARALTVFANKSHEHAEDALMLAAHLEGAKLKTIAQRAMRLRRQGKVSARACTIGAIRDRIDCAAAAVGALVANYLEA